MKGWRTKTFTDVTYRHHRPMGTEGRSTAAARLRAGALDYALGSHPLFEAFRTVYQMTKRPIVIGGLTLGLGYLSAMIRRVPRPVSPGFIAFRRREQMRRLRASFAGIASPRATE